MASPLSKTIPATKKGGRPPIAKKSLEDKLLDEYGGKGNTHLPQTLMFDHVSPATRLLEKRRQMFEVQEALNSQKEEFSRREDAFRRREDGLRRKDLELQESLIKFNKFLQENESKFQRAKKRAADEGSQADKKAIEIQRLEQQLQATHLEESMLKNELEKNIKYQDYLESVVQNMSKFFVEISDILNRYKTLRDAHTYLIEKQMADEALNENLLRDYTSFQKSKENQVLNVNNEISEKQERLEHEKTLCMQLQTDVDQATKAASEKMLDVGQILSSVSNILDRCEESFRVRHNKPKVDRSSEKTASMSLLEQCLRTISKLDEIAMFVVDLKDIRESYLTSDGARLKTGGGLIGGVQVSGGSTTGYSTHGESAAGGKSGPTGGDSRSRAEW